MKRSEVVERLAGIGLEPPDWMVEIGPCAPGSPRRWRAAVKYVGGDTVYLGTKFMVRVDTAGELFGGIEGAFRAGADNLTIAAANWRGMAIKAAGLCDSIRPVARMNGKARNSA